MLHEQGCAAALTLHQNRTEATWPWAVFSAEKLPMELGIAPMEVGMESMEQGKAPLGMGMMQCVVFGWMRLYAATLHWVPGSDLVALDQCPPGVD